jgi:hypothetical protein
VSCATLRESFIFFLSLFLFLLFRLKLTAAALGAPTLEVLADASPHKEVDWSVSLLRNGGEARAPPQVIIISILSAFPCEREKHRVKQVDPRPRLYGFISQGKLRGSASGAFPHCPFFHRTLRPSRKRDFLFAA